MTHTKYKTQRVAAKGWGQLREFNFNLKVNSPGPPWHGHELIDNQNLKNISPLQLVYLGND